MHTHAHTCTLLQRRITARREKKKPKDIVYTSVYFSGKCEIVSMV